jgi:hypothetical protein
MSSREIDHDSLPFKIMKNTILCLFVYSFILSLNSGCSLLPKQEKALKSQSNATENAPKEKITVSSSKTDKSASLERLSTYSSSALKSGNYEDLTSKIDEARKTRERIPGGYWKLYALYDGISLPNVDMNASPSEWEEHLARLQEWKSKMPNSITARIAFAQGLISFGFEARGYDTIDKISDDSIRLFQQRVAQGRKELLDAKELTPKCPHWYQAMLRVGLAQGLDKSEYDRVFEEGFQLEPTYYHLPREKMTYLLPQWMGKEGDLSKFVNDLSERIGGDEGGIMYFELASTLWTVYYGNIWRKTGLELSKARDGYFAMKRIYGVDRFRKNVLMAMTSNNLMNGVPFGDNEVNRFEEALQEVGDDWDPEVWETKERFEQHKKFMSITVQSRKNSQTAQTQAGQPIR